MSNKRHNKYITQSLDRFDLTEDKNEEKNIKMRKVSKNIVKSTFCNKL